MAALRPGLQGGGRAQAATCPCPPPLRSAGDLRCQAKGGEGKAEPAGTQFPPTLLAPKPVFTLGRPGGTRHMPWLGRTPRDSASAV